MSKKNVETFLITGGENEQFRNRYDTVKAMDEFVALANSEGHEFNQEEFEAVLTESGDSFDLIGNPTKRMIWWF